MQQVDQENQLRHKCLIDIKMAFIFGQISLLVTEVENTPLPGSPIQCMRQALEHHVAVFTAVTVCAQCGQLEMISMCVDDGASLAALGDALDQAAMAGQHQAVVHLLQAGAPVDPALLHATQRGDKEVVELISAARAGQLLASGAGEMTEL